MAAIIQELNEIMYEELDEFFDENGDELRPWNTTEWKENREEVLDEQCNWCGEEAEPLQVHHTGSGPNWRREWIKSTDIAFVKSEAWNADLGDKREECPNCGLRDYYARKTKTPRYRCNNCSTEFSSPEVVSPDEVISSEEYDTKPYVNSGYYSAKLEWLKSNRKDAKDVFLSRFDEIMAEYIAMDDGVVTICKSCHFQYEQTSNRRCGECGENWHKYNKEMCWDCLVEKKGLVECDCGDGWYQESKYNACSSCR